MLTCCARPNALPAPGPAVLLVAGPHATELTAALHAHTTRQRPAERLAVRSRACHSPRDVPAILATANRPGALSVVEFPTDPHGELLQEVAAHLPAAVRVLPLLPPHAVAALKTTDALERLAAYGSLLRGSAKRTPQTLAAVGTADLNRILHPYLADAATAAPARLLHQFLSGVWGLAAAGAAPVHLRPRGPMELVVSMADPAKAAATALAHAVAAAGSHRMSRRVAAPTRFAPLCAQCAAHQPERHATSFPFCGNCLIQHATQLRNGPRLPVNISFGLRGTNLVNFQLNGSASYNFKTYPSTQGSAMFRERAVLFPSITSDKFVGLAISGGGSRSLSCAVGQLRALRALGVLARSAGDAGPAYTPKIHYLSATSGGAWASSIYTFSPFADDDLLGLPAEPSALINDEAPAGANPAATNYIQTVHDKNIGAVALNFSFVGMVPSVISSAFSGTLPYKWWNKYVSQTVLQPYGIDDQGNRPFALTRATYDDWVAKGNPNLPLPNIVSTGNGYRPFLVVGLAQSMDNTSTNLNFIPVEVTPLYAGIPPLQSRVGIGGADIGGGFVDPFAFSATSIQTGVLSITVTKATGVPLSADAYVKLTPSNIRDTPPYATGTTSTFKTTVKSNHGGTPTWNASTTFNVDMIAGASLAIELMDKDFLIDDSLGSASVDLRTVTTTAATLQLPLNGSAVLTVQLKWNSFQTMPAVPGGMTNQAHNASKPFTLSDAIGTCSMNPATTFLTSSNPLDDSLIPRFSTYPVQNMTDPRNAPAVYLFNDGGNLENTGIIALLRRGVTRIVACVNTDNPVFLDAGDVSVSGQIALLFGYQPKPAGQPWRKITDPLGWYDAAKRAFQHNQVFSSDDAAPGSATSDFKTLRQALYNARFVTNREVIVTGTYRVLDNAFMGVTGGWNVNICWVYNDLNQAWQNLLAPDVKALLPNSDNVRNFPHYDTKNTQLNPEEIALLGNMHYYSMYNSATLKTFLA